MELVHNIDMNQTVQIIILDDYWEDQVLLVHEIGEKPNGKPKAWALPGGNILLENHKATGIYSPSLVVADAVAQIRHYMGFYNIPESNWEAAKERSAGYCVLSDNGRSEKEHALIYVTSIRECLEETGTFPQPERELFSDQVAADHNVVIVHGRIVAGNICRQSAETDDCRWFPLNALPHDFYQSHMSRLCRGVKQIVDNREVRMLRKVAV